MTTDCKNCNCAHEFNKRRYGNWAGRGPDKNLWLPLETVDSLTTRVVRQTARIVPAEHKNKNLSDVLSHTLHAGYKVTLLCLSKTLSGDTSFESVHTVLLVDDDESIYDICLPDPEFLQVEECLDSKFILAEADLLFPSIEQFSNILTRRLGRHDSSHSRHRF